ncbi:MAG: peptidylprolyl isomerase [Persicimonas sp.]
MSYRLHNWLLAAVAIGLLAACAPEKPSEKRRGVEKSQLGGQAPEATRDLEQEPVVTVGGESISLGEFNRRVRELPEFARVRYSSVEKRQSYLQDVAQFELMADRAEEAGYGDRPEVLFAMKQALAKRTLDSVIRERSSSEEVDEAAIQAHYEANIEAYREPSARRVALIEVESREDAERIRERVLAELDEAGDDRVNAFRRASNTYSVDREIAGKGGDIGFVDEPEAGPERAELSEAVFALSEPGQVTQPVAFDEGFALATFLEERDAQTRPLDTVASEIREELTAQRREELRAQFVDELSEKASVEIDEQLVQKARAPEADAPHTLEDIPVEPVAPSFEDRDKSKDEDTRAAQRQ